MAERKQPFEEIFRVKDPLASTGFQLLLQEVAPGCEPKLLQDFFLCLNDALYREIGVEKAEKLGWVKGTLVPLLEANQQLTVRALQGLLEEIKLHFDDPLMELVFETSSEAPTLLALLGEIVQRENRLLRFRIRALEAVFMKVTQKREPRWLGSEADTVLRFLNQVLYALEQGSIGGIKNLYGGLPENFKSMYRLVAIADSQGMKKRGGLSGSHRRILRLTQEALQKLAVRPTASESIHLVLEVLRANRPLPAWHPAAALLPSPTPSPHERAKETAGDAESGTADELTTDSQREDITTTLALMIDKTIEIILYLATIGWAEVSSPPKREGVEDQLLSPSNQALLEPVVIDQKYPPKVRTAAAALVRVLSCAFPSTLSPRMEFYSGLLLMPYRTWGAHSGTSHNKGISLIDVEEKMPLLLEALDEKSDYVRWNASRACLRAAQDHAEWFRPSHYTKLLSLLSDNHDGVRLDIVRTFGALASFRDQLIVGVIQNISDSLVEKLHRTRDEEGARRDLEVALGIALRNMNDKVDELQAKIQGLEDRSRKLIDYLEEQTMRIGEEIHHEVLNTLCGYLATAIDEEEYAEAKRRLDDLVTELRRIMNNLYPRDLETEGFLTTIRKRLEDARAHARRRKRELTVEFDCPSEIQDEDILRALEGPSQIVLLYRIVLEAITNARKHGRGTYLGIKVRRPGPGLVEIRIGDNGCGNGGPFHENAGIPLMLRRAQEIGAQIEYQKTNPQGGTTVVVELQRGLRPGSRSGSKRMETIRVN